MERIAASIKETSEALSLGRTKIYELINEGRLTTIKIGSRRLVKMDSIRALAAGKGEVQDS